MAKVTTVVLPMLIWFLALSNHVTLPAMAAADVGNANNLILGSGRKLLNEQYCDCNCDPTVSECFPDDPYCQSYCGGSSLKADSSKYQKFGNANP
ncbi:hypothetical protein ACH5RR_021578 [Cinchona calisaya]|uniref:Uncharacterized protein n=1 Tax=Cinchona calisaya TaxID=153742 RepID=A0ABD2ZIP9_9GENT